MSDFCYSTDGERFDGRFDTREAALQEAREMYPGLLIKTGKAIPARSYIDALSLGADIEEMIDSQLAGSIHWGDPIFELSPEKRVELGQLAYAFIMEHGEFNAWGVEDVQEHPTAGEENVTNG